MLVSTLLMVVCCDKKAKQNDFVKYVNGRQILIVNQLTSDGDNVEEPAINLVTPDSARIGEEFLAKISLAATDLMIAGAFVDCENVDKASVDTVTFKVSGCKHGLLVRDDTILVAFKPTSSGTKTFSEITILTRDTDKVFRTMKYRFDYQVSKN